MDKKKLKQVSQKTELQATVTKTPDKNTIAAWYGLEARAMRNRYVKKGVCIRNIEMTERNYGEIFYKCGLPSKIPAELHDWAEGLAAAYCRSLPLSAE